MIDQLLIGWFVATSIIAFLLFGYDKFRAGRTGSRISEFSLALAGAIGGWPGGLLAMLIFRHKTAKPSFQLKYVSAFLIWVVLIYACFQFRKHNG